METKQQIQDLVETLKSQIETISRSSEDRIPAELKELQSTSTTLYNSLMDAPAEVSQPFAEELDQLIRTMEDLERRFSSFVSAPEQSKTSAHSAAKAYKQTQGDE